MDDKQRLQLQNMIKMNNVEDQTSLIRELKHSKILRNEVNTMVLIKEKYQGDYDKIYSECANECVFLFTYYTDLFNKIRKDEIDIKILYTFIDVLEKIENGDLDQHEGSFMVGNILKKIYIDSALRKAEKLDELSDKPIEPKKAEKQISWLEFKHMKK